MAVGGAEFVEVDAQAPSAVRDSTDAERAAAIGLSKIDLHVELVLLGRGKGRERCVRVAARYGQRFCIHVDLRRAGGRRLRVTHSEAAIEPPTRTRVASRDQWASR